jgi:hypothetical protein
MSFHLGPLGYLLMVNHGLLHGMHLGADMLCCMILLSVWSSKLFQLLPMFVLQSCHVKLVTDN